MASNTKPGTVLITGGTGYIGSFTTLALLEQNYDVVIVDSLYNSSKVALDRIELLCNRRPAFYEADITDEKALDDIFAKHPEIDSVIHFAALKAVGESSEIPLEYYRVNVGGSISLLRAMGRSQNARNIVFSSSATVYGDASAHKNEKGESIFIPIPEHCPINATNPYGRTKVMIEQVITDHVAAQRKNGQTQWNGALLRYFNPCGAHPLGVMGEDPQGIPFNLLPLLGQVATGQRDKLAVFGNDYDSSDGTAIRDYIHVIDLAKGHLAALESIRKENPGVKAWNLGSGNGSTVLEIIKAFSTAVGRDLPYEIKPRRAGDVLNLTAHPQRAKEELSWATQKAVKDACDDLWFWVNNNPQGYRQDPPAELLEAVKKAVAKADGKTLDLTRAALEL